MVIAGVLLVMTAPAFAQSSGSGPVTEDQEIVLASSDGASTTPPLKEVFDPTSYGIVLFEEPDDLFLRLTEIGRCPVNEMAPERQPCAFIYYERTAGDGREFNFKPVFKVESKTKIWTIHDGALDKFSVQNLYLDKVQIKGQPTTEYQSFGVVGNEENAANCSAERGCLSQFVSGNMFLKYQSIPEFVVKKLWGKNTMFDPGTSVVRGRG